jgi:serine/threonine protein kinase
MAKAAGAKVIATGRGADKKAKALELGADIAVDTKAEDFAEIVKAGHDIAIGLTHLHPTVLHRDLMPANILIGADGVFKLIDFGLSRGKDPYVSFISTETGGTPNYMPPEMFDGSRIDEKVDIYALGMILFECIVREVPWHDCDCMARVIFQVSIQVRPPPS